MCLGGMCCLLQSLINFVNRHLNKVNLEVTELESQFHDGVYFVLLVGLLEGYFVPLYSFHLTPTDFEQKVSECSLFQTKAAVFLSGEISTNLKPKLSSLHKSCALECDLPLVNNSPIYHMTSYLAKTLLRHCNYSVNYVAQIYFGDT